MNLHHFGRGARCGLAGALGLAVLAGSVHPRPRDLTFEVPGGRLSIGRVDGGPLWRLATARAAEPVTLDNIVLTRDDITVRVPHADVAGTALSRADILALFDPGSPEPWATRLSRLSADSISIPELTIEQRVGPMQQQTTYRDVVARGIAQGRVQGLDATGGTVRTDGAPGGDASGRFGRVSLENLDLAETVRLYAEPGTDAGGPLRTIYGAFSIEDVTLTPTKGGDVAIRRMAGRNVQARALNQTWSEKAKAFTDWSDGQSADRAGAYRALADLLDAFAIEAVEVAGIEVTTPPDQGGARVALDRIAFAKPGPDAPSELGVEGFTVGSPDGRFRMDGFSLSGISLRPTIDGLRALAGRDATPPADETARKLIPLIGALRFRGLAFEVPESEGKRTGPPLRFALREASFEGTKPLDGIPTDSRLALDGLTFQVPPEPSQDVLKLLAGLGYGEVDLSVLSSGAWDEGASELTVRDLAFSGKDMGAVSLKGLLGSVTKDVFSSDSTVAAVALLGATARSVDVTVQDNGLFDRALGFKAKQLGKKPEDIRRDLGINAAVAFPVMLGNTPTAKAIGQAIARFIAKPGRLAFTAKAKEPAGLGFADIVALGGPAEVLDRLEVTARAE